MTVGMLLVVEYLLLAGVRRLIRHSDLAVNLEDFFYWCNAALVIFIAVFRANDGAIRLYSAAAVVPVGSGVIFTKDLYKAVEKVQK